MKTKLTMPALLSISLLMLCPLFVHGAPLTDDQNQKIQFVKDLVSDDNESSWDI